MRIEKTYGGIEDEKHFSYRNDAMFYDVFKCFCL
jgi:hypothetical protein